MAKADKMDIYTAELHIIWHILQRIYHLMVIKKSNLEIVIFSDSKRAIYSLQSLDQQYSQYLIQDIIECAYLINNTPIFAIRFQ